MHSNANPAPSIQTLNIQPALNLTRSIADKYGRRLCCVAFTIIYASSCVTKVHFTAAVRVGIYGCARSQCCGCGCGQSYQ